MRQSLAHLLRRLATWISGEESDDEIRARALNIMRRKPFRGSVSDIETLLRDALPYGLEPTFEWSHDRRTMTMRLM